MRSINAFVSAYVLLMGGAALSVEIPITALHFLSMATRATFSEPTTFISMASNGSFSEMSTNFVAAAVNH